MNKEKYISELNDIKASEDFKQKTAALLKNPPEAAARNRKKQALRLVLAPALAVVLVCALLFGDVLLPNSTVQASENLMEGIAANKANADGAISADFIRATQDFSVRLFQKSVTKDKNSLVSPASVALALGMTANGADGETLKQFENVLGGGMNVGELNRDYFNLANRLKSIKDGKMQIANSVWYRDQRLKVEKDFLQKNADYFGAGAYQLDFTKKSSVDKINNWVKENTGGKIDKMVEKIDDDTMMYLINTLYFEADWMKGYVKSSVEDGKFNAPEKTVSVPFMHSEEQYIHDAKADGMLKSFKDPRFAFAAILPKEGVSLEDYISQMTGAGFQKLLSFAKYELADCTIPKFKYEYGTNLAAPLKALGLTDAFNDQLADFHSMGSTPDGGLFVGDVLHKTFIEVDEAGTKAGAATVVEIDASCAGPAQEKKKIVFDRPFLYAIVDTETNLPIFIGTVYNPA